MPEIDFSAAYRDATKGSTIKALQQRRAEAQAAIQAAQQPRQIGSPWQGAAQIGEVISGSIREGRLANQEVAARQRFAQLLAGGLAPDEIGEALGLDLETGMKFVQRDWAKEDAAAAAKEAERVRLQERGWSVSDAAQRIAAESAGREDTQAAARDAAKLEADAKLAADKAARSGTVEDRDFAAKAAEAAAAARAGVEKTAAETEVKTGRESTRIAAEQKAGLEREAPQTEEAKIIAAYNTGQFGDPASPEAQKIRDAALAKENAIAPLKPSEAYTPLEQETDKKFAEDKLEWKQQGGADIIRQTAQVGQALSILEQPGLIGPTGTITGNLPEAVQKFVNPQGVIARDAIRDVVQSSLKAVLGTQFAAVEGAQLLDRAFDPRLDPAENARRAKLLLQQITTIAKNKQAMVEYSDRTGSLKGYAGPQLDLNALTSMDFGDNATTAPPATGGGGWTVEEVQ